MDEDEQLRKIVRWRKKAEPNQTVKLGDIVEQLMEAEISPDTDAPQRCHHAATHT